MPQIERPVRWDRIRALLTAPPPTAGSPPPSLFARAPFWVAAWALVVGAALAFRPLLPVDETRYAAVGWEMWLRRDLLVPHLNGVPYSDKPPLLFWLFQA